MLKRRPLDGKFPGRGCARKSAPVKGLARAAWHRALLMMRGRCEGAEQIGKQPSPAPVPGLCGPSGGPLFPPPMGLPRALQEVSTIPVGKRTLGLLENLKKCLQKSVQSLPLTESL